MMKVTPKMLFNELLVHFFSTSRDPRKNPEWPLWREVPPSFLKGKGLVCEHGSTDITCRRCIGSRVFEENSNLFDAAIGLSKTNYLPSYVLVCVFRLAQAK
jgi:hypothetical protein